MRLPWRKHKIPCQILWIFRYYAEFIERCYRPLSQLESREMMKPKLVCTVDDPPEYLLLFNFCHNCIFDLYIQVPLRTPMLLRETWIFPKWQDQTFVVNTFILKPLHFPTIIRRVFPMSLSVKYSGNSTWRLDALNLSETWINTSNLEVIDEVKSVPGSQHLCPLRATVWAMLVQHFWCWQNYLMSDEWYSRWESYAKDQKKSLYCHCALAQNTQKPFFWQFDHSINTKTLHQHGSNCSPEWAPMLWTSNTLYCSNYFKIWYDYSGLAQVKGIQPSGQIFRKFYT